MKDATYIPSMLRPGWVLERYYGWSVARETPTLKLLKKNIGPFRRFLMLARDASGEEIAETAYQYGVLGPLSLVVFNDFSNGSAEQDRTIGGVRFAHVETGRWFGVGTFVLDLSEGLDVLWARMYPKERNECRKAQKGGVRVEFSTQPLADQMDVFFELYGRMARERGLEKPRRKVLQRMFAAGNLLMVQCVDSRGRSLAANLVYLDGDYGYYLYGARSHQAPGGAGRYAHWETIRKLKKVGCSWYDLGLVASLDSSDGIYWFKKSFGGAFVEYGNEYQHIPNGLGSAYRMIRGFREGLRKFI
jgi:Acetyltransferase (GNAT) domain